KHGKTNASIPEDKTVETILLEEALPLLAAKAGTKKGTKKAANPTSATKTKKTTATAAKGKKTTKTAKTGKS
ncbi:MAG: topoisomerase C-terminal repeat-containing protein, partial [Thermosynechococcaceae cyanobacterium]